MKKSKKCLSLIVLLVMSVVFFSGCASATYSRVVYDDGSVKDVYEMVLDRDQMTNADSITLIGYLKSDLEQYEIDKRTYYVDAISVYYSDDTKLRDELINGFKSVVTYDQVNYTLKFNRTFSSSKVLTAYVNAMNGTLDESTESGSSFDLESGIFISEYVCYVNNWFDNFIKSEEYLNNKEKYMQFGNDLSDLIVYQEYMCPTSRLQANAQEIDTAEGYTLYRWNVTSDTVLKYFYRTPNMVSWYILALGLTGAVTIGVIIFALIRKRNKEK